MKKLTDDRKEVIMLVLKGELDESHITLEEIQWLEEAVMDAVLDKLAVTNPAVVKPKRKRLTN